MFYIANCALESSKQLGNEMDLVSKVSGMKSSADSIRTTSSSVQITGLRNTSVQARQNVTVSGGPNSGGQLGGSSGLGGNQMGSHIVPISQASVKQVSSTSTGGATLTLIQSSTVGTGSGSTPGGLMLTRPHLSSSPLHHVQHHQLQSPLISVATGTTYHVPRGAAAVANIAAPRSAVASPIIRASSVSGLQVSGGPSSASGIAGSACVGYAPGGALLRPASSSSPSATILPRITSPPASSISTTTVSTSSSVATSVVASSGATAWVSSKANTATPVGGAVIVQPQGHHQRPYSQIRAGGMTVTTKLPLQGHRVQVEVSPVRTSATAATSSSHVTAVSSSSSSTGLVKQPISQHVTQLHIPEKGYFKAGGVSSSGGSGLGAVTIAQVLSPRVGAVSGLSSVPSSISSSTPSAPAFPLHFTPVSSPMSGRPSSGSGQASSAASAATTSAPTGLHGMVSATRIALAGARGHQQLVGPKVIAQPVHGPSSIQITQVPVQVPSSPTASQQHPVSSSTTAPTSSSPAPSHSPQQHIPLQPLQTQPGAQATIHTVVPLSTVHQQQQHAHPVQQHQAHQGAAITIATVVTRALTYTGPTVPGTVMAGSALGRQATMLSVPGIPSPSSTAASTSTTSVATSLTATPPVTSPSPGVPVGKVFAAPLTALSLGRVGLDVSSSGDHPSHQPLVSLQQAQHQTAPGVYIHTSHPRASPAPPITVPRGERSQVVVGGNPATVVQQQLTTSPSPPSTLSSTVPSSTISSTSTTIAVVTTTNTAATYALPTTTYYYGGSGYTLGVARPFSGTGPGGTGSTVAALPGNAGSSFVPIQAVSAAVISSSSVVPPAPSSVVTVAPASPASLTTIRPVGQPGLTTHQVHGIMTTGSGPVRFNPVMVVDATRSSSGAAPFLSDGQYVEVPGAGNGIVGTHFTGSALQPKHPLTTLAPPPAPSASIVSVQASPIKPNSSPRPSILRKRDCDGTPMKAQKNLGPTLAAISASTLASASQNVAASNLGASSHSPPPSPSLGTGNHHTSSSPTSSSSSSSSSSSAGSTTISATSSPGGEVDVGEDSLPPQLLAPPVPGSSSVVKSEPVDDSHVSTDSGISGSLPARPFIPAPPPTQVVVEMSPRKKPRKQQLSDYGRSMPKHGLRARLQRTGNELQEPKFSEDEMEFISEAKIKKEVKNDSSVPVAISAPPPAVTKRPSGMSLLNGYRHAWKSRHNHFIRPGDVRPREERKPSIADIAAQRRVLQKLNGWKVHHLSSQMEELAELEIQVFEKLTEMLGMMERRQPSGGKELEKDVNRINELIKGNLQRSKVIKDQMQEAKSQVMKIFDHKELVSDILSKNASKRSAKKREKS